MLRKPYARVSISPDQVLNVAAVFDPEGTAAALAERKAKAAEEASAESAPKERKPRRARKKEPKEEPAPPPPREVLVETGWPIRIREVRIESGQMNFSDQFIQPNFAADIKDLDGTLTGLSTDPNSSAKVDLKGEVGEFSPVTIAGEIQFFAFDRHTDIGMKFENIPLPIFNPYSGRFAGYNIAKGSLTTDLQYLIEDRKLEAKHHIRIDQLEWGEATESKEAVPLPVKLATSLLKDVDGVIDLERTGQRHAGRPEVPDRTDRLADHQEHPGQGRDRAVPPARLALQGRRGGAVRRSSRRARRRSIRRPPSR